MDITKNPHPLGNVAKHSPFTAVRSIMFEHRLKKAFGVALFGALLDFYNTSLYGFMAPMLLPLFFPDYDLIIGLMIAYGVQPIMVGLVFGPLGAMVLGRFGDAFGRKKALTVSILGMGLATCAIACLPTHSTIGIAAPLLFTLLLAFQVFFAAGEYNGGAIYLLEHLPKEEHPMMSGLYCFVAVVGILLASGMAALVYFLPDGFWRLPFAFGCATAFLGFYVRSRAQESPEYEDYQKGIPNEMILDKHYGVFRQMRTHWKPLVCVLAIVGFYKAVYYLPNVFLTAFLPLINNVITPAQSMLINTGSLLFYLFFLPLGGWVASRHGVVRSMKWASLASIVTILPLFMLLSQNSMWVVVIVKVLFAVLAAWYIGPFHAWIHGLFKTQDRYAMISIGYKFASQISYLSPVAALWLWHKLEWSMAPAIPLLIWAGASAICLRVVLPKN